MDFVAARGICVSQTHPFFILFLEFPDDAANSSQDDSELECTETEEESQEGSEEEEESPKKGGKSKKRKASTQKASKSKVSHEISSIYLLVFIMKYNQAWAISDFISLLKKIRDNDWIRPVRGDCTQDSHYNFVRSILKS